MEKDIKKLVDGLWAEHNKKLNAIIGKNLVIDKYAMAKELTNFAIWFDEEMEKLLH